ncbi:c6 zinc finger domain containing protein [Grosmannia clavigera kw1407]|uniref:C6 zinc finger domain containing protein n=1 Tax=Grosmannia clavigera (strain kw1407 / UAMH 11150) TaxID=655863 RepID=F0XIP9_GROCL|nr:c6 zinc finger domain containing protein [Grosmannia clavigera kw1407]EFX02229.1 c6 zinc finger domain containing protein [Grosmannia clavigera kw1407]
MAQDCDSSVTGTTAATARSIDLSESADAPTPAAKRRRIALACSACRIRKSRCDGVRPRCEPCQRLGFECIYELPDTSANLVVPKDLFAALEDRVRRVEQSLKVHDERLAVVETAGPSSSSSSALRPGIGHAANGIVVDVDGIQDAAADQSMTDGMAVSFVDEQDCGFFGPSSNIAFMRHIFRAMAHKTVPDVVLSPIAGTVSSSRAGPYESGLINVSQSQAHNLALQAAPDPAAMRTNVLPPDGETQALIRAYFANTGLLFPYIHEQSFLETYESMRQTGFRANVRRTWLGLLNMVLAMAVRTAGAERGDAARSETNQANTHERSEASRADLFCDRARELCKTQTMRGTTLETVQYLLLTSQYLQSTQKSVQTWTTHGLAVKAALSIGLHSRDAMAKLPPIEQQTRTRTWFGCVLLDRSLSMTFGRPAAIPDEYVRLDLPVSLAWRGGAADELSRTSTAFYNATILLYRILWKVMATLYGHNLGCDSAPSETVTITQIFHLEQELGDWQAALPPLLALVSPADLADLADRRETIPAANPTTPSPASDPIDDPVILRFRVILTLRHLNLQLLLHRPMLTNSLSAVARGAAAPSARSRRPGHHMQMSFNLTCVRVAEDIIDLIHLIFTRPAGLGRRLTGAWWFTLYYTFNAALAVFGSLLLPEDDPSVDPTLRSDRPDRPDRTDRTDRGARFLAKAIDALVCLDAGNTIVDRCVDYLRQLVGLVHSWGSASSPQTALLAGLVASMDAAPDGHENEHAHSHSSDLFTPIPLFAQTSSGLEDELELGHFFTSEFQRWFERILPRVPVLALLADIGNAEPHQADMAAFLDRQLRQFQAVLLVPGNHEAYHSTWPRTLAILRSLEEGVKVRRVAGDAALGEFVVLDRDMYRLPGSSGIVVLGCSLFSYVPPERAMAVSMGMNDFYQAAGYDNDKTLWAEE